MRCKECGCGNREASKFCAQCGCELLAKQNKKKRLIVLTISLVCIIGVGLGLFFFLLNTNLKNIDSMDMPDNPTETDEYFWGNYIVVDVINVTESQDVLTESEVIRMLAERGFDDYPVTYDYSMEGEYNGELEAQSESNQKHPMYMTVYKTETGDTWSIFVINGSVYANPVSFNLDSDLDAPVLFSESNQLTSYTSEGNKFYLIIPYETATILKEVDKIDATTLNKIVSEEITADEK